MGLTESSSQRPSHTSPPTSGRTTGLTPSLLHPSHAPSDWGSTKETLCGASSVTVPANHFGPPVAERIAYSRVSLNRGEHRTYPPCREIDQESSSQRFYFLAVPSQRRSFGLLKPHLPAAAPEIFDSSERSALFDSGTLTRTRPPNGRLPTQTVTSQHPPR